MTATMERSLTREEVALELSQRLFEVRSAVDDMQDLLDDLEREQPKENI